MQTRTKYKKFYKAKPAYDYPLIFLSGLVQILKKKVLMLHI